jgi:hypothetical protein
MTNLQIGQNVGGFQICEAALQPCGDRDAVDATSFGLVPAQTPQGACREGEFQ